MTEQQIDLNKLSDIKLMQLAFEHTNSAQPNLDLVNNIGCKLGEDGKKIEAFDCFFFSAERGNATAQYNTGIFFAYGAYAESFGRHTIEQDWENAAKWLKKSADQGFARAQLELATFRPLHEILVANIN